MNARLANGRERRLVALTLGDLNLSLPMAELRSLEPVLDLQTGSGEDGTYGTLWQQERAWSVYHLDGELQTRTEHDPKQRICALLECADGALGVLCAEAKMLPNDLPDALPLPACLDHAPSPIEGVLRLGEQIVYCTSTGALLRHLALQSVVRSAGSARP